VARTCGSKEVKYKGLDLLMLHILGKDSPVEDPDSDAVFGLRRLL
jgi:hypothetical protein